MNKKEVEITENYCTVLALLNITKESDEAIADKIDFVDGIGQKVFRMVGYLESKGWSLIQVDKVFISDREIYLYLHENFIYDPEHCAVVSWRNHVGSYYQGKAQGLEHPIDKAQIYIFYKKKV